MLVYISNYADRILLGILLPAIKAEFSLTDTELGFLHGTAFAIFYATLGIPIAHVRRSRQPQAGDRRRHRHVVGHDGAVRGGANLWQLVFARIGVGVGEAGSDPPSHSIISDLFTLK